MSGSRTLTRVGYAALVGWVLVALLPRGLWEDGWFVKRFALNFWRSGAFAWNPEDGPLYGMTSQTLQLFGAALHLVDAAHLATLLKASLALALVATVLVGARVVERANGSALPLVVGLSLPLVLELITSGLETSFALLVVTLSLAPGREGKPRSAALTVVSLLLVYLTRPEAVVMPLVVLVLEGWRERTTWRVLFGFAAAFAALLAVFKLGYGTALPLPFYVKTLGVTLKPAEQLAWFAPEKVKNLTQFTFAALPFVFVAAHDGRRTRALLISALVFVGYHAASTAEIMGHHSRFYVPALAPLLLAAGLAWPRFLERRSRLPALAFLVAWGLTFWRLATLDAAHPIDIFLPARTFAPWLIACALMLLVPTRPLAAVSVLVVGAVLTWPIASVGWETDEAILVRQIAPRRTFKGLLRLRELGVKTVFHCDLGAPGVLLPDARVVDLDGLLSKEVTLDHVSFEALCAKYDPEAIFVPNVAYQRLRDEVLGSECLKRYRTIDADPLVPLRVRDDVPF